MNEIATTTTDLLTWFDRHRVRLWALIGLVYAAGFNGQWRIGPDSAIHVTLARSLAEGAGYTHPTGLENSVHPGLAYLTAATFKLFGVDHFAGIDALMLLCAIAVLVTTYWVVRLRFDRPLAVLAVCMLAGNELFFRYSYQILTDMPFLLGLMLGLLGLELCQRTGPAKWTGFALLPISLLVMAAFRSIVITVAAAGVLAAAYHLLRTPGRSRATAAILIPLLIGGLLLTGWFAGTTAILRDGGKAITLVGGTSLGETLHRIVIDNGVTLLTENLPEAMFGVDLGPWAGTPLGIAAIVLGIALLRTRPMWGMLVLAFVLQWLLFITVRRYSLTIMPLLAIGWWRLGGWLEGRLKPAAARWAVIGLMVLWFAPNTVKLGAFILEQRARPFLTSYEGGRYTAVKAIAHELLQVTREGDLIVADQAPQLIYLTRLPIYGPDTLPTYGPKREDTLERLYAAERVLLLSPINEMLNTRIQQLKLKQEEVLRVVPTPGYDRIDEYKIIRMQFRRVDWDNFRRRQEKLANRSPAPQQHEGETEKPTGKGEQPENQTP